MRLHITAGYLLISCTVLAFAIPASAQRVAAPKLDFFGDPLPPGAVRRLGTTQLQSRSGFSKGGFAWTPDGKAIVTMKHGTASFWDISDGHCREALLVPTDANYVTGFALSRDGKRFVCTDRLGAIASWDLDKSQLVERKRVEPRSESENTTMALSPDGATLVTIRGSFGKAQLQFWDATTCQLQRSAEIRDSPSSSIVFSPSGKTVALSQVGDSIQLFNVAEKGPPEELKLPPRSRSYSLAFTPDGQRLVVSLSVPVDDPPMAITNRRTEIVTFDVAKREQIVRWPIDAAIPLGCSVAISPNGELLATVHPDRILIWDLSKRTVKHIIENLHFMNAMLAQVAIDPSGKYVAVDDNSSCVRLWNLATGRPEMTTAANHRSEINVAAWSPDGKNIVTGCMGLDEVRVWEATMGNLTRSLAGRFSSVRGLAYSQDGAQLVVVGDDHSLDLKRRNAVVRWYDAKSGKLAREHREEGNTWRFALSPDASLVAHETYRGRLLQDPDFSIKIIESKSGEVLQTIKSLEQTTESIIWSADGRSLFQATWVGFIQIDAKSGKVLLAKNLPHLTKDIRTGALSPGHLWHAAFFKDTSEVLTTGSLPIIYGWGLQTGEQRRAIPAGEHFIRGIALSPDESVVAYISSVGDTAAKTLRLLSLGSQKELAHFDLGLENCNCLVFSPDGGRILVGFFDGTALVYDVSAVWKKVE